MASHEIDSGTVTRSNVRLFRRRPRAELRPADNSRQPPFFSGFHDETHVSAVEAAPRAHPRISRPHEHRGRAQGALRAARQGPRPTVRLTPSRGAANARRRLRGAAAFAAVLRLGVRYDGRFLQLIAVPAAQACGRVGYVIARKVIRLAVDRNRLRRRLREVVRVAGPALERYDVVFRVRSVVPRESIRAAAAEARELVIRLVEREKKNDMERFG